MFKNTELECLLLPFPARGSFTMYLTPLYLSFSSENGIIIESMS